MIKWISTISLILSYNGYKMNTLPEFLKRINLNNLLTCMVIGAVLFAAISNLAFIPKVYADEAAEKKLQDDIDKKKGELAKVIEKANKINEEIKNLSGDLSLTNGKLNNLRSQINELQADITNVSNKLEIKKKDLDARNKIKDLLLRNIYISETRNTLGKMLITQGSITEAAQKTNYYVSFISNSNNLII